jgi:hypothetical protein
MRVGGRLKSYKAANAFDFHPVVIPRKHHIEELIIRQCHACVEHRRRHFTEGKIRTSGYWIIGMKRQVTSYIYRCVVCRKLRGKFGEQVVADLPEEKMTPSPPFTFVGVDTFDPWTVVIRRSRGGQLNPNRWEILFTCLVCRAIHIELVEELRKCSSSIINAARRFIAIRGPVRQFWSYRWTNFVGAAQEMGIDSIFVEDPSVRTFLN